MEKIKSVSRLIRIGLLFSITINIFMFVYLSTNQIVPIEEQDLSEPTLSVSIEEAWTPYGKILESQKIDSFWLLVPLSQIPQMLLLIMLWRLFGLYQYGIIFTHKNINQFRYIAMILLVWEAIVVCYPALLSTILNILESTRELPVFFTFGQNEFTRLIIGISIYVIAWVMNEAINIKQEQDLVI